VSEADQKIKPYVAKPREIRRPQFAGSGRMVMLQRLAQIVAVALAVIIVALPLSVCLASTAKMSVEQRECCQKMAGRCETSVMPSSHSCCQHPVSQGTATVARIQRNDFGSAVPVMGGFASSLPRIITHSSIILFESPPESPPQIINVLRI